MLYPAVTDSRSINESVFSTRHINSPAAISTKKVIDIGGRFLKASNSRWHFGDSAIPVIGLLVGLVGIVLQAYATVRDKQKPKWLRAVVLMGLCLTAVLTITTVVISVQFPPVALILSFITIGLGLAMQSLDFGCSLFRVLMAKYKVLFPAKKSNKDQLPTLNSKYAMLVKRQTSLVFSLEHEAEQDKRCTLYNRLNTTQEQLLKIDKKRQRLQNPHDFTIQQYNKAQHSMKGAFVGMGISLGSSILAIAGLTIAVGNPPLGLVLFGLGFLFDGIVLSRKVNKWFKCRAKERRKRDVLNQQMQSLTTQAVKSIKEEQKKYSHSFSCVIEELTIHNEKASNDTRFQNQQTNNEAEEAYSSNLRNEAFFTATNSRGDDKVNRHNLTKALAPISP